ncbi:MULTISPECIES: flavin reductase family protein [unclassified Pseudodesulfovibrio]|uniref:flavin reductase family protein n=1 Tax=unclassified Pseudodesulfovibrio TaxID=2661612 RepID=UPI000FEB885D|nr:MULTISPECIES: flavin reductase family protein [unclassified Pseudodesulfovibrio]MCJ2164339.1 flavin reductase family protein [Pseudodesulfovibrio sp. S3-i]RWU04549.1 flavin reductase family protein [Pseudodesulfovibrio sp. S3]
MNGRINIGDNAFILPEPQTILGTMLDGKPNFMAMAWVTRVNSKPCLMGMAVNKRHASHRAILATGEYSINIPSVDMVAETDYVGLASGNRTDKSDLFDVHFGELANAPLIRQCPLSMEFRLLQQMELSNDTLFVGELVAAWTEEQFLTDGYVDIKKVKPFTLTMPDNRFWAVGEQVGRAWHDGKKLRNLPDAG